MCKLSISFECLSCLPSVVAFDVESRGPVHRVESNL
jgi:hypothetical protein